MNIFEIWREIQNCAKYVLFNTHTHTRAAILKALADLEETSRSLEVEED